MTLNGKNEYQSCFRHYHVTFVQILWCPKFHSDIPPSSPDKVETRLIAAAAVATRGQRNVPGIQMCPWSGYCLSGMSLATHYLYTGDIRTMGTRGNYHLSQQGHMAEERRGRDTPII